MRPIQKWTPEETARTLALLAEGKSIERIGVILDRSTSLIRRKLSKVPGYVPRPAGRPAKPGPKGKLTPDDVELIRKLEGQLQAKQIAEKFDVSDSAVRHIFKGRQWASQHQRVEQ